MEGLCRHCLTYPLYFSPPDGSGSHRAVALTPSLRSPSVRLKVLRLLEESTSSRAARLTLARR